MNGLHNIIHQINIGPLEIDNQHIEMIDSVPYSEDNRLKISRIVLVLERKVCYLIQMAELY